MAAPQVSIDTLKAIAVLSGLTLTDEKLEILLPQVQQTMDSMAQLDQLDLENVEPAITFKSEKV